MISTPHACLGKILSFILEISFNAFTVSEATGGKPKLEAGTVYAQQDHNNSLTKCP